jgi:hypothetical protein
MQVFSGLSIYLQKLSTIIAAFYYLAFYLLKELVLSKTSLRAV